MGVQGFRVWRLGLQGLGLWVLEYGAYGLGCRGLGFNVKAATEVLMILPRMTTVEYKIITPKVEGT